MRILLYSDLHLYARALPFTVPDSSLYDVVVINGDSCNGDRRCLTWLNKQFDCPVIFTLGNHDYYNNDIADMQSWAIGSSLIVLTDSTTYTYKGYTFVGGTGWSAFDLYAKEPWDVDKAKLEAHANISDFICTSYKGRLVTPSDYVTLHNKEWNHIQSFKGKENVIVVTHFPMHRGCLDPFYDRPETSAINPYFINHKDTSGFKLMLSGHTHKCYDFVDENGCRHVNNAYGYKSEFNSASLSTRENGFDSFKIIEV